MMVDVDRLFDEFAASYSRGDQPEISSYLARPAIEPTTWRAWSRSSSASRPLPSRARRTSR